MKVYTQAELEGMSDFELNKMVAGIKGVDLSGITERMANMYNIREYCNNWNDCGALIDECGIGFDPDNLGGEVEWFASSVDDHKTLVMDKNPKRAVTIVYILIKQGE